MARSSARKSQIPLGASAAGDAPPSSAASIPLAERLRPTGWEQFAQCRGLDPRLLQQLTTGTGRAPSLLLWGPPGCGKTTFARLVGKSFQGRFVEASAVLVGIAEVRALIEEAQQSALPTILFIDEIHRFNKAQQDAFLPHVERGTISLIGATTENPSFYCTPALMSRCRTVVLSPLTVAEIQPLLNRALAEVKLVLSDKAQQLLRAAAAGDVRRLLNGVEALAAAFPGILAIADTEVEGYLRDSGALVHDRSGEEHYNVVSAFIKSMRASDPDAALYWGFRMLEAGEDPRFIFRRLIIFASEDIGNAEPRALQIATAAADAFERVGLPEGRIPLSHCITFLASSPKSNRSYLAMHAAVAAVKKTPRALVPMHLRNAPTALMKGLGYGAGYDYPHSHESGVAPQQLSGLPEELSGERFYEPSEHGLEKQIKERLDWVARQKKAV